MSAFVKELLSYGALGAICLFFMWGTVRIAQFLAPKIDAFFAVHAGLVTNLQSVLGRLVDTGADTARGVDALHVKTDGIQRSVDELKVDFHEVKEKVEEHDLILSRKEPRV